ncbi:TPA: histidinol dehydrogenase, partial [Candidatus Sumerlaeota bacterium]|nr:histidinol dehydrogenase [Candidatus Sumerlaeota bacterium]
MKIFQYPQDQDAIAQFFRRNASADNQAETVVREIIANVRANGDKAVMAYANQFDNANYKRPADFVIPKERLKAAWDSLPAALQKSLKTAHARILAYHKHQTLKGFSYTDALGCRFDQRVHPLHRVGVYVPGGTAAYPSTVLMDVVPAKVAGVDEIIMLTPPPRDKKPSGDPREAALGAAWLAGVDQVIGVGGAHGVAALALGTKTLPRVDKIVGPGNKYVAMAKRLLYGEIDIDMIAGPSEILILADKTARPDVIAADMLSQAEHDPDA